MGSLSGGGSTPFPLSPAQEAAVQAAITAFLGAQSPGAQAALNGILGTAVSEGLGYQLLTNTPRGSGGPSVVTIYEIQNPSANNTVVRGTQGAILEGSASVTLNDSAGGGQLLVANSGNDTLNGTGGNDTFVGGSGNDTINLNFSGSAVVYGGTGPGTTSVFANGNDSVINTYGNASLYAGSGNDSFSGGTGSTTFYAGTGNDTFTGGSGAGHSDTFVFDTTKDAGGTISVTGYTPGDTTVQFVGDTVTGSHFNGTSTVVTLNDGTSITFQGIDNHTAFTPGTTTGTVHL